ncbi:MAG: 50S ribosomal protein L18 [Candidatus Hodarchaeales archaeon]|jgi:large subunit ribosomal protein L18
MARDGRYKVKLRRRREGRTDYKLRKNLILSGKPRLVLRKSNKHLRAQVITSSPRGDNVHVNVHSSELTTYGWNYGCGNLPAAYLTGLLLAKKAKKVGFDTNSVLDFGLNTKVYGSRIFAALKGVVDGQFNIKVGNERVKEKNENGIYPSEERIEGSTIANYAKFLKDNNKEKFEKQFSGKSNPLKITSVFKKTKDAIMKV